MGHGEGPATIIMAITDMIIVTVITILTVIAKTAAPIEIAEIEIMTVVTYGAIMMLNVTEKERIIETVKSQIYLTVSYQPTTLLGLTCWVIVDCLGGLLPIDPQKKHSSRLYCNRLSALLQEEPGLIRQHQGAFRRQIVQPLFGLIDRASDEYRKCLVEIRARLAGEKQSSRLRVLHLALLFAQIRRPGP